MSVKVRLFNKSQKLNESDTQQLAQAIEEEERKRLDFETKARKRIQQIEQQIQQNNYLANQKIIKLRGQMASQGAVVTNANQQQNGVQQQNQNSGVAANQ